MTLKAIKQLTNIGWMIGGVSAVTAGYSYINSKKDQVFLSYKPKVLGKISSIEDIEEYEKQKGCLFVFYTKQERKPVPIDQDTGKAIYHGATPNRPSIKVSSATPSSSIIKTAEQRQYTSGIPNYNEWNNGGVLSARNYVSENPTKQDRVLEVAEGAKSKCERGQIIYEEVDIVPVVK